MFGTTELGENDLKLLLEETGLLQSEILDR